MSETAAGISCLPLKVNFIRFRFSLSLVLRFGQVCVVCVCAQMMSGQTVVQLLWKLVKLQQRFAHILRQNFASQIWTSVSQHLVKCSLTSWGFLTNWNEILRLRTKIYKLAHGETREIARCQVLTTKFTIHIVTWFDELFWTCDNISRQIDQNKFGWSRKKLVKVLARKCRVLITYMN